MVGLQTVSGPISVRIFLIPSSVSSGCLCEGARVGRFHLNLTTQAFVRLNNKKLHLGNVTLIVAGQ